ncbi:MAG: hypothetical protein GOMPHAMPRED_001028 [Gomphillus americanus]|uniref:Mannose-P-dolichol utilization defect 1 protein homolog n=1 Tax=Gomphillus americanus TaxID=1940652 RepID=A0A8H3F1S8_9LECA|nr:MAG: hypothetical protein GOMPHAMPRED_001028 [Gomphillus americanus]
METLLTTIDPLLSTLRPHLQPLTNNLPHPLRDFSISLLGESCHKRLILDIAPTPACTSLAISKALGIVIIAASSIVKVPQLLKLVNSRSAAGLSFPAYLLETASFLISLSYGYRNGFPFSTYGESALIALQNIAIAALILHLSGRSAAAGVFVAGVATGFYTLLDKNLVGMALLKQLMGAAGVMSVASKVPQIWTIFSQGGTGQLSAFAVFNYLIGSLSRIYTTLQEVDDKLVLYTFLAAFSLNAVLAAQMVYYWNAPATAPHAKELGPKAKRLAHAEMDNGSPIAMSSSAAPRPKSPTTRRRA